MEESETRMARIVARAAQMQQSVDDADRLSQLEDAAAEIGIDRALMRRAAWEQSLEVVQPPRTLGVPTRVVRRRWLDVDLSNPHTRTRLLARLDSIFGAKGERVQGDAHATWTARHIVVTFESQGDGTLVQISERFVNTASSMVGLGATVGLGTGAMLAMFVVGLLGGGALSAVLAAPSLLLMVGLGIMFGRGRVLTSIANAEDAFERALLSLEFPQEGSAGRSPNKALRLDEPDHRGR